MTEGEAIAEIKFATHRYARRQLTWFRAIGDIVPLACDEEGVTPEAAEHALLLSHRFLSH